MHVRTIVPVAVVALRAAAVVGHQPPTLPVPVTDVYAAGEAGYHTFRIPSLIAARGGALLAFAEGRKAGAGDAGDIDLVLKRSRDGGRTLSSSSSAPTRSRSTGRHASPATSTCSCDLPWATRRGCWTL